MLVLHGPPVYVRKQIVHNVHVVRRAGAAGRDLRRERGRRAGGRDRRAVGPRRRAGGARERARSGLRAIDATCPLVTKVHNEARRFAGQGFTIVLIGHAGHEEVVGTMGEAPDEIVLVQKIGDAEALESRARTTLAYLTQTTLSVDETTGDHRRAAGALPAIVGRAQGRHLLRHDQPAGGGQGVLAEVDLVLVIGSTNSSNSNRLVEVARALGVPAHLIDDESRTSTRVARGGRRRSASPPARRRRSGSSSGYRLVRGAAARRSSRSQWSTRT